MGRPRNIVVLLTDDHGQWALGSSGNPGVRTPNLDFLAETGAVMANAFTPTPVCSPARANFLTGKTSSQHGVHDYLDGQPTHFRRDWLAGQPTLPELLHEAGYQTGFVGKWHLGNDDRPQHGFEHWFALNGDFPIDATGPARYSRNGTIETIKGSKADVLTDEAVAFLRARDPETPFFLFVGHVSTHSAWEGHPPRLVSRYASHDFAEVPQSETYPFGVQNLESAELIDRSNPRPALAQYYAAVANIDEGVGRLLDELAALDLVEETLFVYTSDHGLNCGHHGIWGKGNGTLPLNMVEESIRVPLILSGPGVRASRHAAMVDHLDVFQTLLDYAGVPRPAGNYAGRSFLPLLAGGEMEWRQHQCCEYGDVRMIRGARYKYVEYGDGLQRLFDLERDPREMVDVRSDPAAGAVVADLQARLKAYYAQYAVPEHDGRRPGGPAPTNTSAPWSM